MIFRWSKKYEVLFLTMRSEVGGKDATVFFAVHQGKSARNIFYPVSNDHGFL